MKMKKDGKYKYNIHEESIGNYKDLITVIQKIESYPASLPVFQISRRKALLELLTVHSEIAFLHLRGGAMNIPDLYPPLDQRQNEKLIQESLKWGIKWIFDYCDNNKGYKSKQPSRKEIIETLVFAFKYDLLREILFSAARGGYSIKIDNNKIEFIAENDTHHAFLAYNSWRQAYRERLQFNNIQSRSIEAIKELQSSEFIMPKTWNLGKYTLLEYKRFNISLDELSTRWIINHSKKNRLIIVGEYRSKDLIKIFHKNWWVDQISNLSGLSRGTVESIIADLTYVNKKNNDPAYQFFVPLSEEKLALSACFASIFVRPERNLMALLPKMDNSSFHRLSNDCETQQINFIKQSLHSKKVIIGEKRTRAQETRPGIDILFLDEETLDLLVVELKWTIPPSTASEMYAVDEHVKKGLDRLPEAKEYVTQHIDTILFEYFGKEYKSKRPKRHECCVVMNENIGTGRCCDPYVQVITIDHLIELLNNGVGYVINTLQNKKFRVPSTYYYEVPINFELLGYEINYSGTELKGLWLDKTLPPQKVVTFQ